MLKQIIIAIYIIIGFALDSKAQDSTKNDSTKTSTYIAIEIPPEYPGGYIELIRYINKNKIHANQYDKLNRVGTVKLSFVIEKDGSVGDSVKIIQSLTEYYDKEAIRVVKTLPKWKPGTQNGNPARTKIILPVMF